MERNNLRKPTSLAANFNPVETPLSKEPSEERKRESLHFTRLTKRVFDSPEAREWLSLVRSKTIERPVELSSATPRTHDESFEYWLYRRFREGQNDLVFQIERELNKVEKEP